MSAFGDSRCPNSEATCAYAIGSLSRAEAKAAADHVAGCPDCQGELRSLEPVIETFAAWPTDVVSPPASLRDRLAALVGGAPPPEPWAGPDWEDVAPGIACRLLAADGDRRRVSMLVRLSPGASYPPHTHAGVEELHLLDGELWIDERKLFAGDYNYGSPGASDQSVWSETGCTCLLITSPDDVLR
jgi:anti-sigma factor ChrR (cupin superfamily)